jgi:LysM repeat protein
MRRILLAGIILWVLPAVFSSPSQVDRSAPAPLASTAGQVIAGVNALRRARGLPAYQTNSILMQVCQAQADYMASIGTYSDTDAKGRGSLARAINAGYPAARASENVYEGTNATAQDAINFWTGDAIHRIALFDPGLVDVGAGVAVVANTYYYCQIAAVSSGESVPPVTSAPPPVVVVPVVVSTPSADGSIVHIVQAGETLLGIAQAYHITLSSLEQLNQVTDTTTIYPGDKLLIRPAFTPTGTQILTTATISPTETSVLPTVTFSPIPPVPTPIPSPNMSTAKAGGIFLSIVLIALFAAGAITGLGVRNRH